MLLPTSISDVLALPSYDWAKQRKKLPNTAGIYFWVHDNTVAYIGNTVNLKRRMKSHDHVSKAWEIYENCGLNIYTLNITNVDLLGSFNMNRLILEAKMIDLFKPYLNKGIPLRKDKYAA